MEYVNLPNDNSLNVMSLGIGTWDSKVVSSHETINIELLIIKKTFILSQIL